MYRAYRLDGSNHVGEPIEFDTAGDDQALELAAEKFGDQVRAEIWHRSRLVGWLSSGKILLPPTEAMRRALEGHDLLAGGPGKSI
jgi:hypothetical protein